ncbi:MAG: Stk1 family PASTA domain-containing Ser/Thr kinase [Saccharofermentanales bacterium]
MRGFIQVGDDEQDNIINPDVTAQDAGYKKDSDALPDSYMNSQINQITIGTVLGGRYQIMELLGKGGMANVYLAMDRTNNIEVAIKVLKPELTNDDEFIRRFDTEAKAASSLSYPNIVKVYDVGQEDRLRYMVMEYVHGVSLKELIEKNGHLDWEVAIPIAIQIGLALDNAHKNGVIHRDIKPHNIIVTPEFVAKVTDFGIARAASANTVTLSGKNTMGSVHYFSPEQARGGIVGEQSDIYSLGILIYEMLTGKVPFDGDTSVSIALKHIQQNPVPPIEINADIPKGLNNIVIKCIQKSTELRYKNVHDLVDEMDAFMIEPEGVYGFVDISQDNSKTSVVQAIDRDSNFNKLRELGTLINQKNKVKTRERIAVAFAVILTICIIGGAGYYAFQWLTETITSPKADYIVENYVGSKIEDVKKKLDNVKINYDVFYEQNDTVAQGLVFYQSVQQGLSMRLGGASSITLKVSSGKNTVRLGDYKGRNYKLVESELTQIVGLKVKIVKKLSGEVSKDNVIETIPGAGNDVPNGGEVSLIVSEGLMNVKIPDILGKTRAEAISMLDENYLKVVSEALLGNNPNLPEAEQYIIGVDPLPGTDVKALTGVILTLGSHDDFLLTSLPAGTPSPTPDATSSQEIAAALSPTPPTNAESVNNNG